MQEALTATLDVQQACQRRGYVRVKFLQVPVSELCGVELFIDIDSVREVSIGRSPDNIIVIPDPTVSRKHAAIIKNGDTVIIKDLGSRNGTYVQDGSSFNRISEYQIKSSVIVRLGYYTLLEVEYREVK